jgi:hypothetical protein
LSWSWSRWIDGVKNPQVHRASSSSSWNISFVLSSRPRHSLLALSLTSYSKSSRSAKVKTNFWLSPDISNWGMTFLKTD